MAVSRDDVRHIAALARLRVPDERLDALVGELNGILAHMQVLQGVERASPAPGDEAAIAAMPLRPDAEGSVPLSRALADVAPAVRDGFFVVPRLGTHDDGETTSP